MLAVAPTYDEGVLLREVFAHVTVTVRDVEVVSSERNLRVEFELYGMQGRYRQSSQGDVTSPVWDVSKGTFDLKANLEAELVFDEEKLLSCAHFAGETLRAISGGGGASSSSARCSRSFVDKDRLCEKFGTETVVKLGGSGILLQFLGVICADPGAQCYAEVLPFGLQAAVLAVSEGDAEDRRPRSPRAGSPKMAGSPRNRRKQVEGAGYPKTKSAAASVPAAAEVKKAVSGVDRDSAAGDTAAEVRPIRPPTSDQGSVRPRVGAAKSAAAPKARQSSQSRKSSAAAAPR
jgi:hypothetical protein